MKKLFASLLALALLSGSAHADTVNIMAAFTLKNALDAVIQAYKADGGGDVTPQYGMTPMLAKQVENLAPGDIFLSADADWMNYLQGSRPHSQRHARQSDDRRPCTGDAQ
jgi:molybdate transport system substrate-binding protein